MDVNSNCVEERGFTALAGRFNSRNKIKVEPQVLAERLQKIGLAFFALRGGVSSEQIVKGNGMLSGGRQLAFGFLSDSNRYPDKRYRN